MKIKGESKQAQQLRDEREADEWLWKSIQERSLEELRWEDLMHLARKKAKLELVQWANEEKEAFWDTHEQHRAGIGFEKEFGVYGVRVLERTWSVYVQWFRQEIRGSKPNHQVNSVMLRAPEKGSLKMNKKQFARAKEWELEAITIAEAELSKARKFAEHLKTVRMAISGMQQIIEARNVRRKERARNPD